MTVTTQGQMWVDSLYETQTISNLSYGTAIDFGGKEINLLLDISMPLDDEAPSCGRPLIVAIHGGAWLAGSKQDGTIIRLREDFAEKGYVSVAVNYRLGQLQTDKNIHCNVENWDCLNMADSSEWYRAYYRAVQDVNGAVRYMVNHSEEYDINSDNIFVVGESAGGFVAMGVGFIDRNSEVMNEYTSDLVEAAAPNKIYEKPCLADAGLANSIDDLDLSRPNLGGYEGDLNFPLDNDYRIRGVGNLFGGVFNNIFGSDNENVPALYSFHQPNDLIVPIGQGRVFEGFADCTQGFPLNCQNIINRMTVFGSDGIEEMLDEIKSKENIAPDFLYDRTTNNSDCIGQVSNPSTGGHQLDNYTLRSTNLAKFFASKIGNCQTGINSIRDEREYGLVNRNVIYPNPLAKGERLEIGIVCEKVEIYNIFGSKVYEKKSSENSRKSMAIINLESGIYIVKIVRKDCEIVNKLIVN